MEFWIGKYLEDLGVLNGSSEPYIYYNKRPDSNDLGSLIKSTNVPQTVDSHYFDTDHVGIQFLTRSNDNVRASDLAWDIHRKLTALGDLEITYGTETRNIVDTQIVNAPVFLEVDEKGRYVYTQQYAFRANIGGNRFRKDTQTLTPNNI